MPIEITMPKLGLTMATGTIARWLRAPGDAIAQGDPLLEVATDKINYEVESPGSGTLGALIGQAGDEFECGAVLGTIALAGEKPSDAIPSGANSSAQTVRDSTMTSGITEAPRVMAAGASGNGSRNGDGRVIASPAARRLARERNVSLHNIPGTGPRGRITLSDIHDYRGMPGVPGGSTQQAAPPNLDPRRRAIFRKMSDVALLPLAQVETDARVDALHALIERRGDFGWTAYVVYAVARLLAKHDELRTDAITGKPFACADIGIAADTPNGLIVPVVRAAHTLSLGAMHTEIVRLATAARGGALQPSDIGGACFSISNVGPQKIERVVPLVDPPQTAILGIGAATQRPAVVAGAVVPGWMMTCVLSFDHRFIDGAPAARFLADLAQALGDPGMLL